MWTLTVVLILVLVALWVFAPKIIIKPNLPDHTYDIRMYVARFRVRTAVFAFLLYLIGWMGDEGYLSYSGVIAWTGGILFLSPLFLIEARGEQPGSLYNEIVMRCRGFFGQRIMIATISGMSLLECGEVTTEAAIILSALNVMWTLIPTVLFTKPRWWDPRGVPRGRDVTYLVTTVSTIVALVVVGAWKHCLFLEFYLLYILLIAAMVGKKYNKI